MTHPSIENEFALMMHERIFSLEQLVDGLRRDLDTRSLKPPPTAFSIDSRIRGWYFSVKVWADAWPQNEDGEDRAIRTVLEEAGRLGGPVDLSLVLCKHNTREAQCNHVRLALAFKRVAHADMTTMATEQNAKENLDEGAGCCASKASSTRRRLHSIRQPLGPLLIACGIQCCSTRVSPIWKLYSPRGSNSRMQFA